MNTKGVQGPVRSDLGISYADTDPETESEDDLEDLILPKTL